MTTIVQVDRIPSTCLIALCMVLLSSSMLGASTMAMTSYTPKTK